MFGSLRGESFVRVATFRDETAADQQQAEKLDIL